MPRQKLVHRFMILFQNKRTLVRFNKMVTKYLILILLLISFYVYCFSVLGTTAVQLLLILMMIVCLYGKLCAWNILIQLTVTSMLIQLFAEYRMDRIGAHYNYSKHHVRSRDWYVEYYKD